MSSSHGPRDKQCVKRSKVCIKSHSVKFCLELFQWTTVVELKQLIQKTISAPVHSQRLFHRHIEMSNGKCLHDYGVFDRKPGERVVELDVKQHNARAYIRICPGVAASPRVVKLVSELDQALLNGLAPNLTIDGTGGTYLLRNSSRKVQGVFKPLDEEPFAPFNPRGHTGSLGQTGFRKGVLSGEACYREVAAFELDKDHFSSVPLTTLAEAMHPSLYYGDQMAKAKTTGKIGSLQKFSKHDGMVEDFSPTMFHRQEVQKIAVLDMRILNMDRNESNILVVNRAKQLIPIDHGLSIPDCLDICIYDVCWMSWPHVKDPCTEETKTYLSQIDPLGDITKLKDKFPLRDSCLKNIRLSSTLLVRGVEAGLSLYEVGQIMYRAGYEDRPSELESLVERASKLYEAVKKNLSHSLKTEYSLLGKDTGLPKVGRTRAYSENELEFVNNISKTGTDKKKNQETHISESDVSEGSTEGLVPISEEEEKSDDDSTKHKCSLKRFSSLPELQDAENKLKDTDLAFDNQLFYYIEKFIQQAVQNKLKRSPNRGGEDTSDGRSRSLSNVIAFEDEI